MRGMRDVFGRNFEKELVQAILNKLSRANIKLNIINSHISDN